MLISCLAMLESDGEKARFSQIYKKYRSYMTGITFAILKDNELSLDALNDALFAIAKNISKCPDETNSDYEKAYIQIVTKHAALNIRKKRIKSQRVINLEDFDNVIPMHITPADEAITNEVVRAVEECIRNMPVTYKDALMLKYVYEFNTKEIATALGCKTNTAKKKIQRGTDMLRKELERRGIA